PQSTIRNPHLLKIGSVKIFADGSLGARTAALMEPYADDEGNTGTLLWSQQELDDIVMSIHSTGHQVAIHAVGDRAIASALDAIEKAIKANPSPDHRHRIEHCELVDNKLISRIRDSNIIVSAQPNFIGQWGNRDGLYEKRLGKERWQMMNPLAQFKRKGVPMAFGSDGMPFGPMYGIWSCVNHPVIESCLSPDDAIYCYTYGGAYASFDETKKGTIEVGKLADIVVLSDDITNIPQSDIKDIKVIMTIIGGKVCLDMLGLISPL
ncbi:MAG TPA: amidohydrolase family protein, partial [Candidatus Brocadiales bacterium]|nr:amidohydrolase family protein [Candidatus Brocadiales bacterium]